MAGWAQENDRTVAVLSQAAGADRRKYDGVYKHGGGLLLIVPRALARSVVSTGRQLALARLLPDVVLRSVRPAQDPHARAREGDGR